MYRLNNAIEASEQCENQKRIKVKTIYKNGILTISVSNHFEHKLKIENDKYLSSKTDDMHHGYGIENIKEVIDRLDGTLVIESSNQVFSITACVFEN